MLKSFVNSIIFISFKKPHYLFHFIVFPSSVFYVALDIVFFSFSSYVRDAGHLILTSYCLQLLWALSQSSIHGLMQCNLLVLFSHSLCHSEFLAFLMVKLIVCILWSFWHIYSLFGRFIRIFNSFICRDFAQCNLFFLIIKLDWSIIYLIQY